ncbi:MAG: glycoside hydrolase family 66 protein [Acholeplasmataceae bacterium]|nr:glycoside hydrolase family 66 protein [Acholeplasmataceae bacterium]
MKPTMILVLMITLLLMATSCRDFSMPVELIDLFPMQGRINPGDDVTVAIDLFNQSDQKQSFTLDFELISWKDSYDLGTLSTNIDASENMRLEHRLAVPKTNHQGYVLKVALGDSQIRTTALDVSSDFNTFPRYGYLTDYDHLSDEAIEKLYETFLKHHINGLQFYDWQDQHHRPLAQDEDGMLLPTWNDVSNTSVNGETVRKLIDRAHDSNMVAYAYNLLYGAYQDALEDGVSWSWGLYMDPNGTEVDRHELPTGWETPSIKMMDPGNSLWQDYLIKAMADVFEAFPFDGWHIDQLGYRGIRYDARGNQIDLIEAMLGFLVNAQETLDRPMIFNAVDGYGQTRIHERLIDLQPYHEVWSADSYHDLVQIIDDVFEATDGKKKAILAAYLHRHASDQSISQNLPAVLLLRAAVYASGGSLLMIGDQGLPDHEYLPHQHYVMSEEIEASVRAYDDFMVAYQHLLRGPFQSTTLKAVIEGQTLTSAGLGNTLWGRQFEGDEADVLHLVNLVGNTRDWRDVSFSKVMPETIRDLVIRVESETLYQSVRLMSPEINQGIPVDLRVTQHMVDGTNHVTITIPSLSIWDMIVFIK